MKFFKHLPRKEEVAVAEPIKISINVPTIVAEERQRLQEALANGDLEKIIAEYPVRETPALDRISTNLGFQSRAQYEKAVLKLLTDDDNDTLMFVRSLFGMLWPDIKAV